MLPRIPAAPTSAGEQASDSAISGKLALRICAFIVYSCCATNVILLAWETYLTNEIIRDDEMGELMPLARGRHEVCSLRMSYAKHMNLFLSRKEEQTRGGSEIDPSPFAMHMIVAVIWVI